MYLYQRGSSFPSVFVETVMLEAARGLERNLSKLKPPNLQKLICVVVPNASSLLRSSYL